MGNNKTSWNLASIISVVILLVILGLVGIFVGPIAENNKTNKEVAGLESQAMPVTLKSISYNGQEGKTALAILQETHKVEVQESSMGSFVASIDGTENQVDTFWMFYVDGKLASVGADQYKTKDGEKIEWRFEKFE